MSKEEYQMKKWLITLIIVALIAGGGFFGYQRIVTKRAAAETPSLETAIVQRGDLAVTEVGNGSLIPQTEFILAFPINGKVDEFSVTEGQMVKQGDLLAWLEGNIQAEADFQALFSEAGVAQAELALFNAQIALNNAVDGVAYLIGLDAWWWEKQLDLAEEKLTALNQDPHATPEQITAAKREVEIARGWRDYYRELHITKLQSYTYRVYDEPAMPVKRKPPPGAKPPKRSYTTVRVEISDAELALVYANLEDAKVALQDAQTALEIVRSGSSALQAPLAALGPETERLEQTRLSLENSRLLAPTDGVVTTVFAQAGAYANAGTPIVSISEISILEAVVNLDEMDISRIRSGMPVIISVDAFPDMELSGEVVKVAFTPDVQSGVALYPVTIQLDENNLPLRPGMTVNAVFPIEQSHETLIVPRLAVETEDGQAYVTRVTSAGSARVAVTLGLVTDTEAEILNGLNEGDMVVIHTNPVQEIALLQSLSTSK